MNNPDTELTNDPNGVPHRQIDPKTGQQKAYIVLSEKERAKGFVEPLRTSYIHLKCGAVTKLARSIAETYARDPEFYDSTFCATCRDHFSVGEDGEFVWIPFTGQKVGTRSKLET